MQSQIKFKAVSFSYQDQVKALDQVSFSIQPGSTVALIGKNGSGKSTIAKLIDGLLTPTSGQIFINGLKLTESSLADIRNEIGIVFQNPDDQIIGATVAEDVAFGLENRNIAYEEMKSKVAEVLAAVGMEKYANVSPSTLSGGQKQKVSLARALAIMPSILILDEATSMLDPVAKNEIKHIIKKLQKKYNLTVIYITHDMEVLPNMDQVIALNQSHLIFDGQPNQLFDNDQILDTLQMEPPFTEQVKELFRQHGFQPPMEYQDDRGLSEWITKLF